MPRRVSAGSGVLDQFREIELKSQSKPGVASCRQLRDNGMASVIAAEPVSMRPVRNREHRGCACPLSTGNTHLLHQVPFGDDSVLLRAGGHATRVLGVTSGRFLLWGPAIALFSFGASSGSARSRHTRLQSARQPRTCRYLLVLGVSICSQAWSFSFRRVARYNREVYPRLHWNWEHTYICRRCGRFRLIPS